MELFVLYLLIAALLTLPFGLWARARPGRVRNPKNATGCAFVVALGLVFGASALVNHLYPFGWGDSARAWRAGAEQCERRYAAATTAADTAVVDTISPAGLLGGVPICHSLRISRTLDGLRRCTPGSRCDRLKRALRLPEE